MFSTVSPLAHTHVLNSSPCHLQVRDDHEAVYCESGCERWYHRDCTGMTAHAYTLLTAEDTAEWACDVCVGTKTVPTIKMATPRN